MTIYVSGDSNSVRRNGWVKSFSEHSRTPCEVRNISIGGAPSHMGLLRTMQEQDLKRGDVLIWAYGVNDALYILKAGYPVDELIWAIRKIIQICAETGVIFAPLVFQPRRHSQLKCKSEYRTKLHALFTESGIPYFDVDEAYLAKHPHLETLPVNFYEDYLHYSQDPAVLDHIVEGALDLIGQAHIPTGGDDTLNPVLMLGDFPTAEQGMLENSAVGQIVHWNPGQNGLEIHLPESGRVVGLFLTTTRSGGVWEVTFNDQKYAFSTAFADRQFNRSMLKFISLSAVTGQSFSYCEPQTMTINWTTTPKDMLADLWFLPDPDPEQIVGREARLVGVMIETYPVS